MPRISAYRLKDKVSSLVVKPENKTRLCLPADYANYKLGLWNQDVASVHGSPWSEGWYWHTNFCVRATHVNTGVQIVFHTVDGNYTQKTWISEIYKPFWNLQHDKIAHKISWEFYLDNDLEETIDFSGYTEGADGSPLLYDDNEAYWSVAHHGTGTIKLTISEEVTEVKRGSSSLKLVVDYTGTGGEGVVFHDYASLQDWSNKDFICLWVYGGNTVNDHQLYVSGPTYSDWRLFIAPDNFTGWRRLVFPLRAPLLTGGSPDLSQVLHVRFDPAGGTLAGTWYLDQTVVDVGQWVKTEVYVPDTLLNASESIQVYAWDGAEWLSFLRWNGGADSGIVTAPQNLYFLDGTTAKEILDVADWAPKGMATYVSGLRGETKDRIGGDTGAGTITYSFFYGCKKRIGFAIKMPPDDGQDSSTYGISQCKLKLEICYDEVEDRRKVYDSSDYEHEGVVYGAYSDTAKIGSYSLRLGGTTDHYVEVDDAPSLDITGDITIACWIKAEDKGDIYIVDLVTKAPHTGWESANYRFGIRDKTGKLIFIHGDGTNYDYLDGTSVVEGAGWIHAVARRDNSELAIGVNGNIEATVTATYSPVANDATLRIGLCNGGKGVNAFRGWIDEVRIYNRALSDAEIKQLYEGVDIRDGLVLYFKLDEEIYYGSATYEFEDSTNSYYGLQNINEQWLALFDPNDTKLDYYTFSRRPTSLTVRADENKIIRELNITFPSPIYIYKGKIEDVDFEEDKDGNGVPDVFEIELPWQEAFVAVTEAQTVT